MSAYAGPTEVYSGDNRIALLRKACANACTALENLGGDTGSITPMANEYAGSVVPDMDDNEYMLLLKLAAALSRIADATAP